MKPTPRNVVEAAKPTRSPITPPPKAIIKSSRSIPVSNNQFTIFSKKEKDLTASPLGNFIKWKFIPKSFKLCSNLA